MRIKDIDVIGDIVDVSQHNGETVFLVESDAEGDVTDKEIVKKYDVWNLRFPMYRCTADQLEHI